MISPAVVPVPTAVAVPVPVVEASPPTQAKLVDLLTKKTLNTFTPVATEEATPAPSVPTLKELLLKVPHSLLVLTVHVLTEDALIVRVEECILRTQALSYWCHVCQLACA